MLKASCGDHDETKGLSGRLHDGIPLHSLARDQVHVEFLLGHADEGAHHRVRPRFEVQGVGPIEVSGSGGQTVGQISTDEGFVVAVQDPALKCLTPGLGSATPQPKQAQASGKKKTSHEAK